MVSFSYRLNFLFGLKTLVRIMTALDLNWEIAKSLSDVRCVKGGVERAKLAEADRAIIHGLLAFLYVAVIATVAAYDIYLTFQYQHTLYEMELNPIGRWIMDLDNLKIPGVYPVEPPDVIPFVTLKSIGTLIVVGVISGLVAKWSRVGHSVGIGVSTFQLGLAAFLTFA